MYERATVVNGTMQWTRLEKLVEVRAMRHCSGRKTRKKLGETSCSQKKKTRSSGKTLRSANRGNTTTTKESRLARSKSSGKETDEEAVALKRSRLPSRRGSNGLDQMPLSLSPPGQDDVREQGAAEHQLVCKQGQNGTPLGPASDLQSKTCRTIRASCTGSSKPWRLRGESVNLEGKTEYRKKRWKALHKCMSEGRQSLQTATRQGQRRGRQDGSEKQRTKLKQQVLRVASLVKRCPDSEKEVQHFQAPTGMSNNG